MYQICSHVSLMQQKSESLGWRQLHAGTASGCSCIATAMLQVRCSSSISIFLASMGIATQSLTLNLLKDEAFIFISQ